VALKLALVPGDERFAREAELLSRLHHPCIPRFLDHGHWQSPSGLLHPYVAMELVEGIPLYEWARVSAPTSRQVLQLLAGLARALEATHAAEGVHRDVKGGNVLVRLEDDRSFLVDFGSSHYRGAATLTWQAFPPGTPAYRAPEAFGHSLHLLKARGPLIPYSPKPADDLFALGITAWRLVTGEYPPSPDPLDPLAHIWAPGGSGPRPAHELNARCCPELSAVISRMLSVRPETRGSARELAEALEQAARRAGPGADAPLVLQTAARLMGTEATPQPLDSERGSRDWRPWVQAALLAGPLAVGVFWMLGRVGPEESTQEPSTEAVEQRDGGTVAVGDSVPTAWVASPYSPSAWSAISMDLPSKPFPGQARPDGNGRCAPKQVPINGGCWWIVGEASNECPPDSYVYEGRCYAPVLRPRPPTASPTDAPDGGGE
jgi:serine/threonine-protein kinase